MSAPDLSAEDAAALARLRAHVAKRGGDHDVRAFRAAGQWSCFASYTGDGAVSVTCTVATVAPTPAAAILAAGEALGVAL